MDLAHRKNHKKLPSKDGQLAAIPYGPNYCFSMCGAVFSVLFIYLLNQQFPFAWILYLNDCKGENMWTWKRTQEECVAETVCCPTKPQILISWPSIEKLAYSCIELLLTCSKTLWHQHIAQRLELYILSKCFSNWTKRRNFLRKIRTKWS